MDRAQRGLKMKLGTCFCALEYRTSPAECRRHAGKGQIILLAIHHGDEGFSLLVSPYLAKIVQHDDRQYIDELLQDFHERALLHPDALFQHLSSLSVGPLITHKTGAVGVDDQYLTEFCPEFVSL